MYSFANNQYKLVGYVLSKENILSDNNYVILVTEDGSLLWFNGYDTFNAYNKRVKSIKILIIKLKFYFTMILIIILREGIISINEVQ